MNIVWTALIVVFIVFELITTALVTIWFALGAFAALIASLLNYSENTQIIVFTVVSVGSLLLTYPFVKKFKKPVDSGLNTVVGKRAIIKETTSEDTPGIAVCEGKLWKYVSEDDLKVGDIVIVVEVEDLILSVIKEEK